MVACCEMIARDHGKQLPMYLFTVRNYTTDLLLFPLYLEKCGFKCKTNSRLSLASVNEFEDVLNASSSALIVQFDGGLGGHVVILDEISKQYATIREPFHGMCVEVSADYFCSQVGYEYFAVYQRG